MITVRLDTSVPLVEQIQQELRRAIASGLLQPGDALPAVRQLAADLGINLNTVARAYRELEAQGLVATARGRGTVVMAARESPLPPIRLVRKRIQERHRGLMVDAHLAGLDRKAFSEIVRATLENYPGS